MSLVTGDLTLTGGGSTLGLPTTQTLQVRLNDGNDAKIGSVVKQTNTPPLSEYTWQIASICKVVNGFADGGETIQCTSTCNKKSANPQHLALVLY